MTCFGYIFKINKNIFTAGTEATIGGGLPGGAARGGGTVLGNGGGGCLTGT